MLPKQSLKLLCVLIIDTTLKFEEISYFRIRKMLVKLEVGVKTSQLGYTEPD